MTKAQLTGKTYNQIQRDCRNRINTKRNQQTGKKS